MDSSSSSSASSLDALSLASIYKQHFTCEVNPRNLGLLVTAYMQRTDLGIAREVAANGKPLFGSTRSLRVPVLNMTGDRSPHVEATVAFNGRMQPNKCTWMKIQDAAMILEQRPAKVAEAVKLFLQGLGYVFRSGRRASSVQGTPAKEKASPPMGATPATATTKDTTKEETNGSSTVAPTAADVSNGGGDELSNVEALKGLSVGPQIETAAAGEGGAN